MPRTITVKGIGKVSTKPDFVVLSMKLEGIQVRTFEQDGKKQIP